MSEAEKIQKAMVLFLERWFFSRILKIANFSCPEINYGRPFRFLLCVQCYEMIVLYTGSTTVVYPISELELVCVQILQRHQLLLPCLHFWWYLNFVLVLICRYFPIICFRCKLHRKVVNVKCSHFHTFSYNTGIELSKQWYILSLFTKTTNVIVLCTFGSLLVHMIECTEDTNKWMSPL